MKELYPIRSEDDELISSIIDPETGEILDEEAFNKLTSQKYSDDLKKSLINKMKTLEATQNAIDEEIANLKKLKQVQLNREASVGRFLKFIIESDGEFDGTTCGAKIKKNPPKVEITDETQLDEYIKIELKEVKKLDKKQLKEDLKKGPVKGAKLVQGTRLDIF